MVRNIVVITYSKKTDKFQYANTTIGGKRFVKEDIAWRIKEQMPKRLSTKKEYGIEVFRAGKTYNYAVTVIA